MSEKPCPSEPAAAGPVDVSDWTRALAGKRLLVTGAAGFIGGALFRRLRDYGCDVTATVLYPHEADDPGPGRQG
jgi:FlaA1/EpsC-like NDP-sugar epimerase